MSNANTMELENKMTAWLSENNPAAFKCKANAEVTVQAASPEHSTNVAASTAVVLGGSDYKADDGAIKDALKKDREKAIKLFKESPLSGCTTVLDMARISSGYDPNVSMDGANQDNYRKYLSKVLECPLFHLKLNTCDRYNRNESSWDKAIEQISDLFTGVEENDKEKIKQSIKNLTNAVTSNYNTRQGTSIFSVSALNTAHNNVEAYIFYSNISMCESKSKGSDCKQSALNIFKTYLEFRKDLWPVYAEKIFNVHYEAVDDWITANSTKIGEAKTNLCIGGYKEI